MGKYGGNKKILEKGKDQFLILKELPTICLIIYKILTN